LLRVIYGLLRIITIYEYTICYELSRAIYGHFKSFLRIATNILRKVTIYRSFYLLATTRLRFVTISYESLVRLRVLAKSL